MIRNSRLIGGLIVLAIAITLVLGSCTPAVVPATNPTPTPTPTPTSSPNVTGATLNISTQNGAFDKSSLAIHMNTKVTLVFDNKDPVQHNVAIYKDSSAAEVIFRGEVVTGPKVINYEFTAPSIPGTYFFRCDVHPNMTGSLVVAQ